MDYTFTIIFESAVEKREFLEVLGMDQGIDMVRADRFVTILRK